MLVEAKPYEESVGDKLDVLVHEEKTHSDQTDGIRFRMEILLDGDGFAYNFFHSLVARTLMEVIEQKASKLTVTVHVTRDELVGTGETWHETLVVFVFEPGDGSERSR